MPLAIEEGMRLHTADDRVARERAAFRAQPDPSFLAHGPSTRRE